MYNRQRCVNIQTKCLEDETIFGDSRLDKCEKCPHIDITGCQVFRSCVTCQVVRLSDLWRENICFHTTRIVFHTQLYPTCQVVRLSDVSGLCDMSGCQVVRSLAWKYLFHIVFHTKLYPTSSSSKQQQHISFHIETTYKVEKIGVRLSGCQVLSSPSGFTTRRLAPR